VLTGHTVVLVLDGCAGVGWTLLEFLSYLFISPFFMHLLEGNPKLAGQQDKKRRTATQMCPRLVCFVHNIIQVRVGPQHIPFTWDADRWCPKQLCCACCWPSGHLQH
jgi:hypothetical protein